MKVLYNVLICFLGWGMILAAFFHPKAKKWVTGRKKWRIALKDLNLSGKPVLWMHCASLGEFEQGIPVLEAFRKEHPDYYIYLTFYSPSGYEVRKDYSGADSVGYLPLDSVKNAHDFVKILNPTILILVKYELWLNLLYASFASGVKVFMISAIFRQKHSAFRSPFKLLYQDVLRKMNVLFVQDEGSQKRLSNHGIPSVIAGDTRFDRVKSITKLGGIAEVQNFKQNSPLLIVGSAWQPEQDWIAKWFSRNPDSALKVVIAPHNLNKEEITTFIKKAAVPTVKYTQLNEGYEKAQILILDTMGMLTAAYFHADFTIVGGGFNKSGIHNILEPAAFGAPVMIGPNFEKFKEARDLNKLGGVEVISSYVQFEKSMMQWLTDKTRAEKMGKINLDYVNNARPATEIILNKINKEIERT